METSISWIHFDFPTWLTNTNQNEDKIRNNAKQIILKMGYRPVEQSWSLTQNITETTPRGLQAAAALAEKKTKKQTTTKFWKKSYHE